MILFFSLVIIHEDIHSRIFVSYDCTNIHTSLRWSGAYTGASCPNNDSNLAQSINEIVGYTAIPMFTILIFILLNKNFDGDD